MLLWCKTWITKQILFYLFISPEKHVYACMKATLCLKSSQRGLVMKINALSKSTIAHRIGFEPGTSCWWDHYSISTSSCLTQFVLIQSYMYMNRYIVLIETHPATLFFSSINKEWLLSVIYSGILLGCLHIQQYTTMPRSLIGVACYFMNTIEM